jgi:DNA-binding MarR family transcriptional regulator
MATIHQQIKKLEADADLIYKIREKAKTDGGRLTTFGKDFLYACVKSEIPNSDIAKILDVTQSAVSQNAAALKG